MKNLTLIILSMIAFTSASFASERSPNNTATCTYSAGDIGTIKGHGANIHKARSQASLVCFDLRADLAEKRGALTDQMGLDIIDSCANIRCK